MQREGVAGKLLHEVSWQSHRPRLPNPPLQPTPGVPWQSHISRALPQQLGCNFGKRAQHPASHPVLPQLPPQSRRCFYKRNQPNPRPFSTQMFSSEVSKPSRCHHSWLGPLTYILQERCRWAQQPRLSRAGICLSLEIHPAEPPSLRWEILEPGMPSLGCQEGGSSPGRSLPGMVRVMECRVLSLDLKKKQKPLQRARHGGDLCLFCSVNNPWHVLPCGVRVDQTKLHLNYNRARYLFFNIFLWSPSPFIVS